MGIHSGRKGEIWIRSKTFSYWCVYRTNQQTYSYTITNWLWCWKTKARIKSWKNSGDDKVNLCRYIADCLWRSSGELTTASWKCPILSFTEKSTGKPFASWCHSWIDTRVPVPGDYQWWAVSWAETRKLGQRPTLAKKEHFFWKKCTKKFRQSLSNPFSKCFASA